MTQLAQKSLEEGTISDADFAAIAGLVREWMGIDLQPHKRTMVASRLSKRLRATGYDTVNDYIDYMHSPQGRDEQTRFISAYTTNMTRFNREGHHFEQLANDVLPDLMAQARRGKRIRIWSAGCSSGEEPYGLAFHVLDACPEAASLDVKILASDIDPEILATAKRGVYPTSSINTLTNGQGAKYFEDFEGARDQKAVCQNARDLIVRAGEIRARDNVRPVMPRRQMFGGRIAGVLRQGVDRRPARPALGQAVGVQRDEKIGLGLMRDGDPVFQRHEDIRIARQQHVDPLAAQCIAQVAGEVQHQAFFIQPLAFGAWVDAPMTGIEHHGKAVRGTRGRFRRRGQGGGPAWVDRRARGGGKGLGVHGLQRDLQPGAARGGIGRHADFGRDHVLGQIGHQTRPAGLEGAEPQGGDAARFGQQIACLDGTPIGLAEINDQPRRIIEQENPERHALAQCNRQLGLAEPFVDHGTGCRIDPRHGAQLLRHGSRPGTGQH